jgi:RNA ligase
LDYQEDQLILTAIRSLYDGRYVSRDLMQARAEDYRIPVVRAFNMHEDMDMKAFVEYVRDLEDLEGFIVRFDDGHMLKLKCHWYLQIHKAKEAILQDRNIVELILDEKLDDVKAHLPAEDRDRLTQFENSINSCIRGVTGDLLMTILYYRQRGVSRKDFAITHSSSATPYTKQLIFALWDEEDLEFNKLQSMVRNVVTNNIGRTAKYEALRDVWFPGVKFNEV